MRRIHVLFVVNGFSIGGGEIKLLELIREITEKYSERFKCSVCSVGIDGPLRSQFEALGLRTEVFLKSGPYDVSQIFKLIRLIREERIEIVQTTLFYADVLGTYAARMAGIRHIISWEAVTQPYSLKHLYAYRLASKWFTMSVSVSQAIERQVIEHRNVPPKKTCTIHYGVDVERFSTEKEDGLKRELGIKNNKILIGTVARLTEQKGHRYLIAAIPNILKAYPNVEFVLIGDGPLREELSSLVLSLNINSSVHFLGFRDNIPQLLRNLDLFVLPSLYEGLPNVVLEAMASGLPVVATAVDGTPEAIVHGKTGFLVPSCQPDALSDAICTMLNDREKMNLMGRAGRHHVETRFSLNNQVNQFVQLYNSLSLQGG